jgi:hypothetical protein
VAADTALQTSMAKVSQVQQKLNQCCNITVDPETSASENGAPYNDLVSRRFYDKNVKVIKIVNIFAMF